MNFDQENYNYFGRYRLVKGFDLGQCINCK